MKPVTNSTGPVAPRESLNCPELRSPDETAAEMLSAALPLPEPSVVKVPSSTQFPPAGLQYETVYVVLGDAPVTFGCTVPSGWVTVAEPSVSGSAPAPNCACAPSPAEIAAARTSCG